MEKIIFTFSDYSQYDKNDIKKYCEMENKQYNDEQYFKILSQFISQVKNEDLISIKSYKEDEEDDNYNYESKSYGKKISSKIMDINLTEGKIITKCYIAILRGIVNLKDGDEMKDTGDKDEGKDGEQSKKQKEEQVYDVTVEIGSRFDTGDKQPFLRYLLSSVYDFKDIKVNKKFNPKSDENDSIWYWLLIIAFRYQLENAYKIGLFKKYKRFEYNDSKVKGTIDINKHIKYNIPFNGKIAYSKRELTHDNEIMHLILHSYEVLNRRHPETLNFISKQSKAYEAICAIREVAPNYKNENVQALISKCSKKITHPYYHRYEHLRKICLLILKNKGISFFDGQSSDIIGIIMNISKLWEEFLNESVLSKIKNTKVKYQNEIKLKLIKGEEKQKTFPLKPDYVIEKGNGKYVIDAKYKIGWQKFILESNIDYISNDYRQITNYVYLLDAQWGGVIFPYKKDNEGEEDLSGYYLDCNGKLFYLFALEVPSTNNQNLEEWKSNFESKMKDITKEIEEKIYNENKNQ